MFRKVLLASVCALPVAAVPALAADPQGGDDRSYGERARANQPEDVGEIQGLNSGQRQVERFENPEIAGGDPTFAMPVSALMGRTLHAGDSTELGTIRDIVIGPGNRVRLAVVDIGAKQVAVAYEDLKVRTGRGPGDLLLIAGLSEEQLAGRPAYEFGGGMAAVTAPQSDAAGLSGNLDIGSDDGGQDFARQRAEDMQTMRMGELPERSAMLMQGDADSAPDRMDEYVATVGAMMDQWYRRMAGEWQQVDVADDTRAAVNEAWTGVVNAWGDLRRAAPDTWNAQREDFRQAMEAFRTRFQQATTG